MCRLGFACRVLGEPGFPKMHTCILKNASTEHLIKLMENNLLYVERMIEYCAKNQIYLVRIGSDMIPFASHPEKAFNWQEIFRSRLKFIGNFIRKTGIRVSMHPGQYTVLNALNEAIVEQSIREITWHTHFLDALKVNSMSKVVLHIGGVYDDKVQAMERFIKNFQRLDDLVKARIVLENDEKNYTIKDVLTLSSQVHVPVVFDVLHHQINPPKDQNFSDVDWICKARKTWNFTTDGRQKIHYSQQKLGGKTGAHSDTIDVDSFKTFYETIKHLDLDIMLEVKDKNLSVLNCRTVL